MSTSELKVDFIKLAERYAGKWVALDPHTDEVVASGDTPSEVLSAAADAGVAEPFITRVVDDYGAFVTCLA